MRPSEYIQKGWCQFGSALDTDGYPCHPSDKTANRWCLSGAILAAYPENPEKRGEVIKKLFSTELFKSPNRRHTPVYTLSVWNDQPDRTEGEVMALLHSIGE